MTNNEETMFYAQSTDDYHYVKVFKPNGEFLFIVNVESADKLLKVLNDLNIDKINAENVLTDFMSILNEIQYYFREGTTVRDLDGKDFYDLVKLSHRARDMLQNMNMELKE